MKIKLLILALLLAVTETARGQAIVKCPDRQKSCDSAPPQERKVTVMMTGDCHGYADTVTNVLKSVENLPRFEVVIACNDATWRYWQMRYGAQGTNDAFTNGKYTRVVLRGRIADNPFALRIVLLHEIEHLRCRCRLEESHL